MRANSFNTGIASEYLILSKLYRLELEAYVSQGNKKTVDIRVIRENGIPISIDVKSVRGYSSLVVNNVEFKNDHFIVFVIYNNKFDDLNTEPDIFVVPSREISNITETYGSEKRVMKGSLSKFQNQWDYIKFGYGEEGELNETREQEVIADYATVRELQNLNYSREQICNRMSISPEELTILEIEYNKFTGN